MPVEVQCPISSSLGEFPSYWDWLWTSGVLGFRPYWFPSPFPSLSILGVFHSLFLPLDFNRVSSLWPTYRWCPDPALTVPVPKLDKQKGDVNDHRYHAVSLNNN